MWSLVMFSTTFIRHRTTSLTRQWNLDDDHDTIKHDQIEKSWSYRITLKFWLHLNTNFMSNHYFSKSKTSFFVFSNFIKSKILIQPSCINLDACMVPWDLYPQNEVKYTNLYIFYCITLEGIIKMRYYNLMGITGCLKPSSHIIEFQNICFWSKTLFGLACNPIHMHEYI